MQTGIPLIIRGASNFAANRPNSTGESAKLDNPTRERWFNTEAFVNPPDYQFGNVGRTLPDVRTPGTVNFDLSLIKDTKITEHVNLQFRAESFNFLNHVNLSGPNATFTPGTNGKERQRELRNHQQRTRCPNQSARFENHLLIYSRLFFRSSASRTSTPSPGPVGVR